MKKIFLGSMLMFSLMANQANAVIGLATGVVPVTLSGVYLVLGSIGLLAGKEAVSHHCYKKKSCSYDFKSGVDFFADFFSIIGFVSGVILLDDQSNIIKFKAVDEVQANNLGLTKEEFESYNSELELINLIAEEVSVGTSKVSKLSMDQAIEVSKKTWAEGFENVSNETKSAMVKILAVK